MYNQNHSNGIDTAAIIIATSCFTIAAVILVLKFVLASQNQQAGLTFFFVLFATIGGLTMLVKFYDSLPSKIASLENKLNYYEPKLEKFMSRHWLMLASIALVGLAGFIYFVLELASRPRAWGSIIFVYIIVCLFSLVLFVPALQKLGIELDS